MKSYYIMGTAGSGKTAFCLALALDLVDQGLRVGYFKPVGWPPRKEGLDDDAFLFKSILDLPYKPKQLVPVVTNPFYLTKYGVNRSLADRVSKAFEEVSADRDVVIVEGTSSPRTMASLGLDGPTMADRLDAIPILVQKTEDDFAFDQVVLYSDYMRRRGRPLLGVVFNNIARPMMHKVRDMYCQILDDRGEACLGVIPSQREIASPTAREFWDLMGGELLAGEDNLDQLVEGLLVGAMSIDSALGYMRRSPNKALITGGDRGDLVMAALETSTALVILTGGIYPSLNVISRAEDKGVPLLLVPEDTYTTVEKLHAISRKIRPQDTTAIEMARRMFDQHCDRGAIMAPLSDLG